jgi:hypothetical protein
VGEIGAIHRILIPIHGTNSIQREGDDSFHQRAGLKYKEEISKVLHLKHRFARCSNLDTSESRSQISQNFSNEVLAEAEEDQ